jgi:hypothetical protein
MHLHVRLKPKVTELSLQQNMGSCQREEGDIVDFRLQIVDCRLIAA